MPPKRTRSIYTEDTMAKAIWDVTENRLSQHKAAEKWGVPQRTISDRFRGQTALADQIQPNQRLSKHQEARLVS
jgi:hypothetical protein